MKIRDMHPDAIAGHEVHVAFHLRSGRPPVWKHWTGSEATCRRKARLMSLYREVLDIKPVTARQWIAAYGDPSMKAES